MDEWIEKLWHIYNGILLNLRKGDLAICSKMDEIGGHYAQQNKPDLERQILHDVIYMWNLRKVKITEAERKSGCLGLWGGGNGEVLVTSPFSIPL